MAAGNWTWVIVVVLGDAQIFIQEKAKAFKCEQFQNVAMIIIFDYVAPLSDSFWRTFLSSTLLCPAIQFKNPKRSKYIALVEKMPNETETSQKKTTTTTFYCASYL